MSDWISKTEALARITLQTGLQNADDLLSDAIASGKVKAKRHDIESFSATEKFLDDPITIYAGGLTYIDNQYDPAFQSTVNLSDLLGWIAGLLNDRPARESSKAGRKPQYDWDEYERVFRQRVAEIGLPDAQNEKGWRTQTDVKKFLLDLAAKDRAFPSDTIAKQRAREFINRAVGN